MGLGIIISGVFILRVKPNARFVAAWIAFTAVIYAVGKSFCYSQEFCCIKGDPRTLRQLINLNKYAAC